MVSASRSLRVAFRSGCSKAVRQATVGCYQKRGFKMLRRGSVNVSEHNIRYQDKPSNLLGKRIVLDTVRDRTAMGLGFYGTILGIEKTDEKMVLRTSLPQISLVEISSNGEIRAKAPWYYALIGCTQLPVAFLRIITDAASS